MKMDKIFKKELKFNDFGYEALKVYQLSYQLGIDVFEITKSFPKEEIYSLTDQVRRSSRSVAANIGEAYRKRVYPKSFLAKIVDSDAECTETMIHLNFALDCHYISAETKNYFEKNYSEVGRMLNSMIQNPEKFALNKPVLNNE
jgi:four helix bundle protein